jgi:hypothetical protein
LDRRNRHAGLGQACPEFNAFNCLMPDPAPSGTIDGAEQLRPSVGSMICPVRAQRDADGPRSDAMSPEEVGADLDVVPVRI